MRTAALILIITFVTMSCAPFRDSPFSDTLLRGDRNLNTENIYRITDIERDQKVRIAIVADSHGNYRDMKQAVREINAAPDIDFTVHLGDFTNSGYNYEYDQFLALYSELRAPRLIVIGNHDALGAGPALFQRAFGPFNYFFESEHLRFIFWNPNEWEAPETFDPHWLAQAVHESQKSVLIFTHVPLDDHERFHGATRELLLSIRDDPKVQAVFNGHNHGYQVRAPEKGSRLIQAPRVEGGGWILVEIQADGFRLQSASKAEWLPFRN